MALTDVFNALSAALQPDGSIDLYGAATGSSYLTPLVDVLGRFRITAAYTMAGAQLSRTDTSVTLTGNGAFRVPGAPDANSSNVAARLLCTGVGDGPVTFELTLTITDPGWTFGKTFPTMPESQRYQGGAARWTASFLIDVRVDRPAFSARSDEASPAPLHLSGSMPEVDLFRPFDHIVLPWPLRLNGTVSLPADAQSPPALELLALSSSGSLGLSDALLQLGGLALQQVGFRLASIIDLDQETWGRTTFSALDFVGTLTVGSLRAQLSTPVLATGPVWHLFAEFDEESPPLVESLAQLAMIFGLPALPVPPHFIDIAGFKFSIIELYFRPPTPSSAMELEYIAVSIESDKSWTPPVPFVTIKNVCTRWVWGWTYIDDQRSGYLTGSVYGSIEIGRGPADEGGALPPAPSPPPLAPPGGGLAAPLATTSNSFTIDVAVTIPSWVVTGQLSEDNVIPVSAAFRSFFGDGGPPTQSDMNITAFVFEADPQEQSYDAVADIVFGADIETPTSTGWSISLVVTTVVLQQLSFHINMTGGVVSGGITGIFALTDASPDDEEAPRIMLSALYPGRAAQHPEGWTFAGLLFPGTAIDLTNLVSRFLGVAPPVPDWVPRLSVDRLYFSLNTGTPTAYTLGGTVSLGWQPRIFGTDTPLKVIASASLDMQKLPSSDTASGRLEAGFAINKIALSAGMDLGAKEPTYLFKVLFGDAWIQAVTSWRGKEGQRHQAITIQLGGVTLGDILEYLVNLAQPTLGYTLDPPWDVLKRIDLSRFVLTFDPQESSVEFVYSANADLVIMRLDTIGVRYQRTGDDGTVELILTGSFLGKRFDGDNALTWDVINDPPPAVPGQDETLIDLRYLGLGQRIALSNPPNTVAETIAQLRQAMKPIDTPDQNPLTGQNVIFSPNSQWLIGLDVGLLDTVDLGFIFNDPVLYGLSIALGGERAGDLAGLRFEILYKKITNDIGMFRVELRLPEAFRHIELGEVSITLGVVVVEIYTNGNFLIDLGFPYNRAFERSFSVQVFPFIGRGGLYFGLLDGNTSRRVPQITNGTFAPVIELGVGLAVGVGKDISVGPLSGGIYVEVEVIFQGVLAWFNPTSSGAAPAKYYWVQGIAAIHGKLYGSVDFKVIKVSVTLDAYAQASVLFEAYQPTVFRLNASVSVEAEVTIVFVSVSFSFDVDLDVSFTIGSVQPTPWVLAGGQGASSQSRLRSNILPALRRDGLRRTGVLRAQHMGQLHGSALLARALAAGADLSHPATPYLLNWQPKKTVFSDSPRTAPLTMLPAFSVADVPLVWNGPPPANASPRYRAAFLVFADSGVSALARTSAETHARSGLLSAQAADADETSYLPADTLVRGLLLYALYAIPHGPSSGADTVNAGQLALLIEQMSRPETADIGFSKSNLDDFFPTNIHFQISGDPGGTPAVKGGMALPLPPYLSWQSPQGGSIDFGANNKIGPLYEWGVAQLLGSYFPLGGDSTGPSADDPATYESFDTYVFRDYCLMIARAALKEARDALDNFAVPPVTDEQSLAMIANTLPSVTISYTIRAGDTVDSVAAVLGATPAELLFLNPSLDRTLAGAKAGDIVSIKLGVAPEVLALDNPDVSFAKTSLVLGNLDYQVANGDTLNKIAAAFNIGALSLLTTPGLGDDRRLLWAGATFVAPQTTYTPPADFTRLRAAAVFYVRYAGQLDVADMAWYAQAVYDLNRALLENNMAPGQPVPTALEITPGLSLQVPKALHDVTPAASQYTTLPGDTLTRIGAALALEQNHATGTGPQGWATFRDAVTLNGGIVTLPAWQNLAVLPGETPAMLARRTVVNWVLNLSTHTWQADWAGLLAWIGGATVLAPLAVLAVPGATTDNTTHYSFTSLAQKYSLSIGDLAGRLKDLAGLYAVGTKLMVTHLPTRTVDDLVGDVATGERLSRVITQASRMLLAGLQLPKPREVGGHVEVSSQLAPLLDLTGQQFDVPVDSTKPADPALQVQVSSNVAWITLMSSTTVGPGETVAQLQARAPDVLHPALNRGLALGRAVIPGMVVQTGTTATLTFSYSNADILARAPATGLAVPTTTGPAVLALSGQAPRTYSLDQRIELQTPQALPIPGGATLNGQPSLWPFPAALRARAQAHAETAYEILRTSPTSAAGSAATPLLNSTYATLVVFRVRRDSDSARQLNLIGVDTGQRSLLLALRAYLIGGASSGTTAWLLLAPPPDATNTSGITVLNSAVAATYLIKTNLSTDTVPQPTALPRAAQAAKGQTLAPLYYASLSDLASFLLLLWEGSVVGGTGYYFGVGQDLPGSTFDDESNATLQLLVIVGEQQSSAPTGRKLLPFNTCALVGPGLDPSAHALFVEGYHDADHLNTDLITQALLPPGNIGFDLLMPRPQDAPDPVAEKEVALRKLYSALTFAIPAVVGSPYQMPPSGLPVPPQSDDGANLAAWERHSQLRRLRQAGLSSSAPPAPKAYWRYEQVLPIYRFGTASVAPAITGLPAPADDPYRGVGAAASAPTLTFHFGFGDLLGNRTGPTQPGDKELPVTFGYTDPIVGVGSWPAVNTDFGVAGSGSSITLSVTIRPKPAALMPAPAQPGNAQQSDAVRQAEKYRQIYYQMIQPNLSGWVVTTLAVDAHGTGIQVPSFDPLWRFAGGAYAHATSVAALVAAAPTGAATLGAIITQYGVRWTDIAHANAGALMGDLFSSGASLTVPAFVPFAERDTANSIAAAARPGWPAPTATSLLTFTQNAAELPLRIGTALSIPSVAFTLGTPGPTLAAAALAHHTTVALLAADSQNDPALANGFVLRMEGVTVTVGITPVPNLQSATVATLAQAVAAFAAQGVNIRVVDLAIVYAEEVGLLKGSATMHSSHYIAKDSDTLSDNASGVALSNLIAVNLATPNLFDPGALIYLGAFSGPGGAPTLPITPGETLRQFAERYACPIEQLLSSNPALALPPDTGLVVPGALRLPDQAAALRLPYTLRSTDTLGQIAQQFLPISGTGDTATKLAIANQAMPGTIAGGQHFQVTVAGNQFTIDTTAGDTFATLLAQLKRKAPDGTMADLIAGMQNTAGLLQGGALLLCPPARLASAASPNNIPTLYGIDSVAFALANAAVLGLVAPGQTLYAPNPKVHISTQAGDTLNALIGRFADAYAALYKSGGVDAMIDVGIADIISANPTVELFSGGGVALLPPAPINLTVPLQASGPYPAAAFPLQVTFRIVRPTDLIYSDFQTPGHNSPVERAETNIPAPASDSDASLTFNAFLSAMQTTFPNLRLASGKVDSYTQDLWAVDFGASGIANVTLAGGVTYQGKQEPRFIALKPLYNHLVSRSQVPIKGLDDKGKLTDQTTLTDFQGIDVEVWAQRFLADADRFLSATYAAAVYADLAMRDNLTTLLDAKNTLTGAIADGLDTIFQVKQPNDPDSTHAVIDPHAAAGVAKAREALLQQLGISLAHAYATAALIQYDGQVTSPWISQPSQKPADLLGDARQVQPTPGQPTLTSAKTFLNDPAPYVTFLIALADPASHQSVTMDLDYQVSHLEFNIADVAGAPGYLASDWLSFMQVLAGEAKPASLHTLLGQTDVPIPLRAFPALPIVLNQTSRSTKAPGDPSVTLADAAKWTYSFTYSHEHAEQDEVEISIEFNLQQSAQRKMAVDPTDLFTELAKYIAVANDLWKVLAGLVDQSVAVAPEVLHNTVGTFATLAKNVADNWQARRPQQDRLSDDQDLVVGKTFAFRARVTDVDRLGGKRVIDTLTLTRLQDQPGPTGQWPLIWCRDPEGNAIALTADSEKDRAVVYHVPAGHNIPADTWPIFTLAWPGLNVAENQNARVKLAVRRNQSLLGPSGPDTNAAFLFETAMVESSDITTPLNLWSTGFQLSGTDPGKALDAAFDTLFPQRQQLTGLHITMGLFYSYELTPNPTDPQLALTSELPVGLYPNGLLDAATGTNIANALKVWHDNNKPNDTGGNWLFSFTLYSPIDPGARRPLLILERLVYPIPL
jgi:LysM domain